MLRRAVFWFAALQVGRTVDSSTSFAGVAGASVGFWLLVVGAMREGRKLSQPEGLGTGSLVGLERLGAGSLVEEES